MATNGVKRVYDGRLPTEVLECFTNARFLHLATCNSSLRPHVALMNYTYVPSNRSFSGSSLPTVLASGPGVIIMLLSPTTKKLSNIKSNPSVSLLVHDWISPRPPGQGSSPPAISTSATGSSTLSPLAMFLQNLNSGELKSHSHTIRGYARILENGSEEENYYKEIHREANKFEDAKCYVEGEEGSQVVVVEIEGGKIADWKGEVEEWGLSDEE